MAFWELVNFTEGGKGYLQIRCDGMRVADAFPYAAKTDPVWIKESAQHIVDTMNSVHSAGTDGIIGQRNREGRLQRELPSPRLCRESGGVAPTAQMTRADGRKRAEVQGSAPSVEEGGKPSADISKTRRHLRREALKA